VHELLFAFDGTRSRSRGIGLLAIENRRAAQGREETLLSRTHIRGRESFPKNSAQPRFKNLLQARLCTGPFS
jgi:hypothetical protein